MSSVQQEAPGVSRREQSLPRLHPEPFTSRAKPPASAGADRVSRSPARVGLLGWVLLVGLLVAGLAPSVSYAESLPVVFQPQPSPAPSSLEVSISAPLVGRATDTSRLSGEGVLVVGQTAEPFDFAQLLDVSLVLDDGMDFSLLGGAVTASAEPGIARIVMVEAGAAGVVTDGRFDQLENLFQFEGEIFLSTEEGPYDLSTMPAMMADLTGIQLRSEAGRLSASGVVDVEFTAAVAVPVLGQVPLTIAVHANVEAIASLPLSGDFDNDGQLDANDIDLLFAAIRAPSADPRFDLNGDGTLSDDDAVVLVEVHMNTYFGDANVDGMFDTADLVAVMQVGEYEDAIDDNSGWADGDWTGDADFDSSDLVRALQSGCFEACGGPRPAAAVPEPSALSLALLAAAGLALHLCFPQRRGER